MSKKTRKKFKELDFDPYDDFDEFEDSDMEARYIAGDQNGDDYYDTEERFSARRKIERRNDMKKLYSQLDDWEQFGGHADW